MMVGMSNDTQQQRTTVFTILGATTSPKSPTTPWSRARLTVYAMDMFTACSRRYGTSIFAVVASTITANFQSMSAIAKKSNRFHLKSSRLRFRDGRARLIGAGWSTDRPPLLAFSVAPRRGAPKCYDDVLGAFQRCEKQKTKNRIEHVPRPRIDTRVSKRLPNADETHVGTKNFEVLNFSCDRAQRGLARERNLKAGKRASAIH